MSYTFEDVINTLEESAALYGAANKKAGFLVDAQLPKKLSDLIKTKGHQSIHTLDLPDGNKTTDKFIKEKVYKENLILITKDDDFLHSFLIEKKPRQLILVRTGNISNDLLLDIFDKGLSAIILLIEKHGLIEITKNEIVVHN